MTGANRSASAAARRSHFDFAPPRNFLLPAVLLLLCEEPTHGYGLVERLTDLRFGAIDRPSVYRTLAQLERDELISSSSHPGTSGHERRVYALTVEGERTLRGWMGTIKEERDGLDRLLRRYRATRTMDAAIAEVEGGWGALRPSAAGGWSPISTATEDTVAVLPGRWPSGTAHETSLPGNSGAETEVDDRSRQTFKLAPDRSVILVEVRSTVGPISFGVVGLRGSIEARFENGRLRVDGRTTARIEIPVDQLSSGNRLYDAELRRRIGADTHPIAILDLRSCDPVEDGLRYRLTGDLVFHGVTKRLEGSVAVRQDGNQTLVVIGEQRLDVRDFDIASPTVLMLRIYPDVTVKLHAQAELVPSERAADEEER